MSHKATNWAVEQRGLKPIAKVLLWHLADRHHPDNGCFPSQAALAADCEISRASVNRHLDDLESLGLIRREQRVDPASRKQLPTRYVLAFEDDFGTPDVVVRVSDGDTGPCHKNDDTRVSKTAETVSHSSETLTSKITSNLTGKAVESVSFDELWEVFPRRKLTNRNEARSAFDELDDGEKSRCLIAAKRFAQWHIEDSEVRNATPDSQVEYRVGLGKWIRSRAWIEVLTVVLKSDPAPPSAEGVVTLPPNHPDVRAVERLRGKPVILGKSGNATLRIEEIEQARKAAA